MIPLLVIATQPEVIESYISAFITEHAIPDYYVFHVMPEKKELSIDQIRNVNRQLIHQRKDPQLFVLYSFDNASQEAQNAMLKTLEEKSKQHYFILVAGDESTVLPTIKSRTQTLRLEKPVLYETGKDMHQLLLSLTDSPIPSALASPLVTGVKADTVLNIFDEVIVFFRSRLATDTTKATFAIREALRIKSLIQFNNLNPQLALDNLLLQIHKAYRLRH